MLPNNNKFIILESYADDVEVIKEKTIYAPKGTAYIISPSDHNIEDIRRWQNRYAKAITKQRKTFKGLVYWQERAIKAEAAKK